MALSADNMVMAIGAPGDLTNDDPLGYVKVYQRNSIGSSWTQIGLTITGEGNGDQFGRCVALSGDGKTLAIGSPGYWGKGDRPGYTAVYYWDGDSPGSSWKQLDQDILGEVRGGQSGWSVLPSKEGKTLAISATNNGGNGTTAGHVMVYHMEDDGPSWKQLG